jgi:hypothetical protein
MRERPRIGDLPLDEEPRDPSYERRHANQEHTARVIAILAIDTCGTEDEIVYEAFQQDGPRRRSRIITKGAAPTARNGRRTPTAAR